MPCRRCAWRAVALVAAASRTLSIAWAKRSPNACVAASSASAKERSSRTAAGGWIARSGLTGILVKWRDEPKSGVPCFRTPASDDDARAERHFDEAALNALALNIKTWGRELGFGAIGISDTDLSAAEAPLAAWLEAGCHGEMDYMAKHGMKRARPAELVAGTRRVITARIAYLPAQTLSGKAHESALQDDTARTRKTGAQPSMRGSRTRRRRWCRSMRGAATITR